MNKNLITALAIGGTVIVLGGGAYFLTQNKPATNNNTNTSQNTTQNSDDFQKMGQYSFGVDVCNEMTKEKVGEVIGKSITKTKDYSNSGSTGCEYFISNHFVIIDVGFGDMEKQRTGLKALDRTIKTDSRIGLENMLVYSDKGLIDVYMDVAPGQKYVRVGRSSTAAVDEETLIKLAIATETKIRSFK